MVNTPRYKAVVSGQITCSGSLETPVVQGTLQFEDIALRPAMSLLKSGLPPRDATVTVVQTEQDLTVAAATESPSGELASGSALPPTPGLLQRLAVDLTVKIPRDTWVHMHEGSIELTGKLQVKKTTNEEPTLSGRSIPSSGWYAFHGRKFRVLERGQILFRELFPLTLTGRRRTLHHRTLRRRCSVGWHSTYPNLRVAQQSGVGRGGYSVCADLW